MYSRKWLFGIKWIQDEYKRTRTINQMRRATTLTHFIWIILLGWILFCIWPTRFATNYYSAIRGIDIPQHLVFSESRDERSISEENYCDYNHLVRYNEFYYTKQNRKNLHSDLGEIMLGGIHQPSKCVSKYSTAIIVPYRNRADQLEQFLIYMHNFLRMQMIHYKIYVIEQDDNEKFNRAKLLNIGATYAANDGFTCLILHDVDLIPLQLGNIYACTDSPRHMCSSLNKFRFNLMYEGLFGGAVSIQTETFKNINGLSNAFEGWGGEDDDFYERVKFHNHKICRFEPDYSRYVMLTHKQEKKNEDRNKLLLTGKNRFKTDGLNSLEFKETGYEKRPLFTRILVTT